MLHVTNCHSVALPQISAWFSLGFHSSLVVTPVLLTGTYVSNCSLVHVTNSHSYSTMRVTNIPGTCSYICSTDPQDVARVEGKTFICTKNKHTSVARSRPGAKGGLGLWLSPEEAKKEMDDRWPGCMAGGFVRMWTIVGPVVWQVGLYAGCMQS